MIPYRPIIQQLDTEFNYHLDILRLDLIDEEVSGNKWFKLKRNIEEAKLLGLKTVLTFGGTFSNHIAATAAACKKYNLNAIGVIRGDEKTDLNETLSRAKENGMHLHFVSRETYTHKTDIQFQDSLKEKFGDYYLVPEGGNNKEGVLGSTEIFYPEWEYDYILCACGTATTFMGLLLSAGKKSKVIGVSVLKGENFLVSQTQEFISSMFPDEKIVLHGNEQLEKERIENSCITNTYCFKGFAKYDKELVEFKNDFERKYAVPLDYLYTNKLLYATFDLMGKNKFKKDARILIIHSGGLQGNKGFEERYHLMPTL